MGERAYLMRLQCTMAAGLTATHNPSLLDIETVSVWCCLEVGLLGILDLVLAEGKAPGKGAGERHVGLLRLVVGRSTYRVC